jgi:hypothetical protein
VPVIVIGADTPVGEAITASLTARKGEVRAFVSNTSVALQLRNDGAKVAVGDISDGSHLEGAARGCFSAVVIPEAAFDSRERSFSDSPAATVATWLSALSDASIKRLIWLKDPRIAPPLAKSPRAAVQVAIITTRGRSSAEIVSEVVRLDALALPEEV